jgi:hypothetical protein
MWISTTATMAETTQRCKECDRNIRGRNSSITCTLCQGSTHNKCLPSYSNRDIDYANHPNNHWSCPDCLATFFPFSNVLENNFSRDLDCHNSTNIPDLSSLESLVFDPFNTSEDLDQGVLGDVDPDENYLHDIRGTVLQNCK